MTEETKENAIKWAFWLSLIVFLLFLAASGRAQENFVRDCATRPACTLGAGIAWSAPTQTWIFNPISPDTSFRIYVHNNNTTNGHTAQTITAWITSSTVATSLVNNASQWVQLSLTQNTIANAKCTAVAANNDTGTPGAQGMGTCYTQGMYAAAIAIQFTPGGAQAGTTDTFDIGIVQCPNNHCNYPGGPQPGADSSAGGSTTTISPSTPADATSNTSVPGVQSYNMAFNGTTWERWRSINGFTNAGSGTGAGAVGLVLGANALQPTEYDIAKSLSIANNVGVNNGLDGILLTSNNIGWTVAVQGTAANCSASTAANANTQHCATGVTACIGAVAAQGSVFVNLRNGASGAGTVIWNGILIGTAGTGMCVSKTFQSPICASTNTAITLELSAATAGTVTCATTLEGVDVE